jgi:HKD family nuclease
MELKLITQENSTGIEISTTLRSQRYSKFKFAVAYARNSGVGRIYNDLARFTDNGGETHAIIGIDQFNTSYQALINLRSITNNRLYIHNDRNPVITFHPKIYLFGNREVEKVIIGSSNLTAGGFYLNLEVNVGITLDNQSISTEFRNQVSSYWEGLISDNNTKKADNNLLKQLLELGKIVDETKQRNFREIIKREISLPFGTRRRTPGIPPLASGLIKQSPLLSDVFGMTLSRFDVSSFSQDPVILIPKSTLETFPLFWNWPDLYTLSHRNYPQFYTIANVQIDNTEIRKQHIRIYYYDRKKEFRLQCEPVKRNGSAGDILLIKKNPRNPLEFIIVLIRKNTSEYNRIFPRLSKTAPGGQKHYDFL